MMLEPLLPEGKPVADWMLQCNAGLKVTFFPTSFSSPQTIFRFIAFHCISFKAPMALPSPKSRVVAPFTLIVKQVLNPCLLLLLWMTHIFLIFEPIQSYIRKTSASFNPVSVCLPFTALFMACFKCWHDETLIIFFPVAETNPTCVFLMKNKQHTQQRLDLVYLCFGSISVLLYYSSSISLSEVKEKLR